VLPTLAQADALLIPPGSSAAAQLRQVPAFMGKAIINLRLVATPQQELAEAGNFPDMACLHRREIVAR
jgi:hypothetical protein